MHPFASRVTFNKYLKTLFQQTVIKLVFDSTILVFCNDIASWSNLLTWCLSLQDSKLSTCIFIFNFLKRTIEQIEQMLCTNCLTFSFEHIFTYGSWRNLFSNIYPCSLSPRQHNQLEREPCHSMSCEIPF